MAGRSREEVKVVLIDTQYVVTDPLSFKSVVQRLTGKDSCVSWIEESSFAGVKRKRSESDTDKVENSDHGHDSCNMELSKGLSFKDLDRLIMELPPMEEWYQLWTQNNLL
ncbi:hypothetical protein JCGZ_04624 [Jatropha curcas]|uniref:VQ domain-containing protein n=1 Tax=Jatropha curcas TaxID=180498 RepID=A0A067KP20_JATCU|nr:VQ motif-containing protein 1 [Jatropha curcas]KDP37981.1 hypothetical protein JCGZ_04624 [Jatropha curcas]